MLVKNICFKHLLTKREIDSMIHYILELHQAWEAKGLHTIITCMAHNWWGTASATTEMIKDIISLLQRRLASAGANRLIPLSSSNSITSLPARVHAFGPCSEIYGILRLSWLGTWVWMQKAQFEMTICCSMHADFMLPVFVKTLEKVCIMWICSREYW